MGGGTTRGVAGEGEGHAPVPRYLATSIWEGGDPSAAESSPPPFPEWIDCYRREVPLGEGGMGVVWRYRDTALDRLVAVKTTPEGSARDREFRRRSELEARTLAALDHPNIGRIYRLLEESGRLYLILEFVPGRPLSVTLREGPLSLERSLGLGLEIARAIEAGSARGIVHRDIKPGNIMVTPSGSARLLDYGLARFGQTGPRPAPAEAETVPVGRAAPDLTAPGRVMGTYGYMSPEQARGEEIDGTADVWAFGCVLYECLAGRPAFPGATRRDRLDATLDREPDWDRLPEGTPAPLRGLLAGCLRKDPRDRPRSGAELAEELRGLRERRRPGADGGPILTNLPTELTPFVGRESDITEIQDLLETAHLITLTGPGGAGKTRLAYEVARASLVPRIEWTGVRPHPDGVFVVPLGAITDPRRVAGAVAATVPGCSGTGGESVPALIERLADRRLLLVLDNCDRVLEACRALLGSLLVQCPGLRVLATSREPLGMTEEQLWPVAGLRVPAPEAGPAEIDGAESIRLFVLRAQRARPHFALEDRNRDDVAVICRRLEGMPLAIELAASRVKSMPVAQVARRLLDVLDPDRVLETSIEWSVELLDDAARTMLQRLLVFRGGWTLEAVERVCAVDEGGSSSRPVIEQLGRLVDKSLVVYEERGDRARYHLLEVVAARLRERLPVGDDVALRRRHLDFYEALAASAEPHLTDHDQAVWFDRLEIEHENLLAAFETSQAADVDSDRGARFATHLYQFWYMRDHLEDGRACLERALARRPDAADVVQMRTLNGVGNIALRQGDLDGARRAYDRALDIARALVDRPRTAGLLTNLGLIDLHVDLIGEARGRAEEAISIYRELEDSLGVAWGQLNLSHIALRQERPEEARSLLGAALPILRASGEQHRVAVALLNLARAERAAGRAEHALDEIRECLRISLALGDRKGVARATLCLGIALEKAGQLDAAARMLAAGRAMHENLAIDVLAVDRGPSDAALAALRERLGRDILDEAGSELSASFPWNAAYVARLAFGEDRAGGKGALG